MLSGEKKALEWVEKHLDKLVLVAITIISLLIRYSLRYTKTNDSVSYLLPWYQTIADNGGIFALKEQVGDYNLFYQFIIALWTYIPVYPLFAFKIPPILFDYLLAAAVAAMTWRWTGQSRWKAVLAYCAVVLSPTVFLDSAAWAQCDSIYVFLAVLAIYFMIEERYGKAFVFLGAAFSLKLQAVFVLPFFLFVYFRKRKFSLLQFGLVPVVMLVSALPAILMGRGILDVFTVYRDQTGTWPLLVLNYPSVWLLAGSGDLCGTYYLLKDVAVLLTLAALIGCMVLWTVKKLALDTENMVYMAFLLVYTCVMFLPAMHERYGYLYEILALVVLFFNRKTLLPFLSIALLSFITFTRYVYQTATIVEEQPLFGAWNLAVYVIYFMLLMKRMEEKGQEAGQEHPGY